MGKLFFLLIGFCFLLSFLAGCSPPGQMPDFDEVQQDQLEENELRSRVNKLEKENQQLAEENETLRKLDKEIREEALDRLDRISIRKRSALYDKDRDDKLETLIVYLETIDKAEDRVKAGGSLTIELWDLNKEKKDKVLLQEWSLTPEELKEHWGASLMSSYYRLTFDVSDILTGGEKELHLTAEFVDYLTGNIYRTQRVINQE